MRRSDLGMIFVAGALALAAPAHADVVATGLIGYWAGNGSAVDSSPTGNNGYFTGNYRGGRWGQAFDLRSGKVHIADNPAYDLQQYPDWTIGFWMTGPGTYIGQDIGPGETPKWFIDYGYGGNFYELHVNDYDADPREFLATSAQTAPRGWTHLALVRHGSALTFFVNGTSIDTLNYGGAIPDPAADLVFGDAEPCCQYAGAIDEVTIYNRALSATEVGVLARPPLPEPGVWALMITGFGWVGAMLRRRRRATA